MSALVSLLPAKCEYLLFYFVLVKNNNANVEQIKKLEDQKKKQPTLRLKCITRPANSSL